MDRKTMKSCMLLPGANGKLVETFVGDIVRVTTVQASASVMTAYVDGFTAERVKLVSCGRVGYYLPKNLVFVERGRRDGTIPVEPYRVNRRVPEVVSIRDDSGSEGVAGGVVRDNTARVVEILEEVSENACKMVSASVEFAVTMERAKVRLADAVEASELEEVKQVASVELERRMEGFDEFVKEAVMAAFANTKKK